MRLPFRPGALLRQRRRRRRCRPETMSLETLLEAARFLELQEQKEQQRRQQLLQQQQQPAPILRNNHLHNHQQQPAAAVPPPTASSVSPQQPPLAAIFKTTSKQEPIVATIQPQQQQQQSQQSLQQPLHQQQQQQQQQQQHHQQQQRIIQNSFDIINPLVIDEGGEQRRKQPPLVFRSGTREVHNKLEKHRRAHLKECFDLLKQQLPPQAEEKKTSNLSILHSALRYIQSLKRKERDLEHEMERLAREKIAAQQKLAALKKDPSIACDSIDFNNLLPEQLPPTPASSNGSDTAISESVNSSTESVNIPLLTKSQVINTTNGLKDNTISPPPQQQQVPTALSVVPMAGYPVSQGVVVHKLALVPKGFAEISPLTAVSSPVAHFITTTPSQQINGKVLPMVNTQYVVKPVVVVSSPPSVAPRPS